MIVNQMLICKKLNIIEDFSEMTFGGSHYDFHNNYVCKKICIDDDTEILTLSFHAEQKIINLIFLEAVVVKTNFTILDFTNELTLDTLYRGRFEETGRLQDLSKTGCSYFYAEFYDGEALEFFAKYLILQDILGSP